MDLFKEILPSIMRTKKWSWDINSEKTYVPFVVNKALSYHMDCVLFANQMNLRSGLDPVMQYDYYFKTIRAQHRDFQPWQKKEKSDALEAIKSLYGYSNAKAAAVINILSEEQLKQIIASRNTGGIKK